MRGALRSGKTCQAGQGMVEFALVLPVLLLLMLGIIEFGRLLFFYAAVTASAREAARYGAAAGGLDGGLNYYQDCDGIRQSALRIGNFVGIQNTDADIQIRYDSGPGTANKGSPANNPCPPGNTGPDLNLGDRVKVVVTADFTPITPLANLPSFTIQAEAKRTVLVNVPIQ